MYIVSIKVNRSKANISEIQEILTKYGEKISARIGLHELEKDNIGVLIVVFNSKDINSFVETLNLINGVTTNFMEA